MLFSVICWNISREEISRKDASYQGNNLIGHHCVQRFDEIRSRKEGGSVGMKRVGAL
jgi:hypothetical protein